MDDKQIRQILEFQKNEITEYHIYTRLAGFVKSHENSRVLAEIGNEELAHYEKWKTVSGQAVRPNMFKVFVFVLIGKLFGYTFAIKLMEMGEEDAQDNYGAFKTHYPDIDSFIREESEHEEKLMSMLNEERLHYIGSIVLGLNDALVELTGALAGLTFALQNTRLIALTGLITGIAASLSMAASEYLSTKTEGTERHPIKASLYTGTAYVLTVMSLILPYLLLSNYYVCLALTMVVAVMIIAFFNYYLAVVEDVSFRKRFLEMALLSTGVAGFSFLVGVLVRHFFGVDI